MKIDMPHEYDNAYIASFIETYRLRRVTNYKKYQIAPFHRHGVRSKARDLAAFNRQINQEAFKFLQWDLWSLEDVERDFFRFEGSFYELRMIRDMRRYSSLRKIVFGGV